MATIVYDCPSCGAKSMTFAIQNEYIRPSNPQQLIVGATCMACNMPITAMFYGTDNLSSIGYRTASFSGNLMVPGHRIQLSQVFPDGIKDETPPDIPENVRRAFIQASGSRSAGHFDAASGMYRKSMELALKAFSPDIDAWKIEKRIDRMAAENRITPELKTWAHELRLDGNDALHGDDEATGEMVDQMHEFCKFLLIYLYALPAQVLAAKARRQAAEE